MKNVCIKVLGADREPIDRAIAPGTTATELLQDCGLRGYILSMPSGTGFFGPGENVYSAIEEGECLLASSKA
jgi:hypothetical protein